MADRKKRRRRVSFLSVVGELVRELEQLGQQPTLVGGMALVVLGSTRVTKDFDLLIGEQARDEAAVVHSFYEHGFELASKIDEHGDVVRTIDNRRVAHARLRGDQPKSAYFYNRTLGLRVDLLFDFPISAAEARANASPKKIQSYSFHIASRDDLIRMKEIAAADRGRSSDLQDLEFLNKT